MTRLHSPDGTDHAAVDYSLRYLEGLFNFILGPGGDRFLHKKCNTGEVAQDLKLNIPTWVRGAAEHGRSADDECARALAGCHVLDIFIEALEDTSVFVRGAHEGPAFLDEDSGCALDRGVDEGDNLEAGAKFTVGGGGGWVREVSKAVQRRKGRTALSGRSGSKGPHQSLYEG
jgi:hypothetical protein